MYLFSLSWFYFWLVIIIGCWFIIVYYLWCFGYFSLRLWLVIKLILVICYVLFRFSIVIYLFIAVIFIGWLIFIVFIFVIWWRMFFIVFSVRIADGLISFCIVFRFILRFCLSSILLIRVFCFVGGIGLIVVISIRFFYVNHRLL
jgi:hypothetical protein